MKTMVSMLGLVVGLASAAPARAQRAAPAPAPKTQTALKLELQVEPVANQAELMQLMRRNTVRVALQRHQLWQQAVAREEQQAGDPTNAQPRHRHRDRHRVRKASMGTTAPTLAPKAMRASSPRAAGTGRPTTRVAPRPMAPANLRQLLRLGRAGDAQRLERKLRARIREQRRQRERLRQRGQGGAAKGHRHGGRSGR